MKSFHELSRREDDLVNLVREIFGEESVGHFGIGVPPPKGNAGFRKRNNRKARRARDAASDAKDNSSSDDEIMGQVDDIIIEAQVPATATRPSSRIYLTTWDGYFEIDCSWVRESGMSKHTKDWWVPERELRYPAHLQNDFPIYDAKMNSLSPGAATENFISVLPESVLHRAGLPIARADFMSYITGADFDIMRLLNTLLRVTRLEELPTDNVPLMGFGQVIDIKEPLDIDNGPVDDGESKGTSNIAPEDPSSPPRRRVRLIVSSTSSDEVDQSSQPTRECEAGLLFRGNQAYLVRDIRGERVKRGRKEYHVFWEGYASSEATWEQASNVNKQALDVWLHKKRKK